MFVLEEDKTFTWPVTVNVPADGGKFDKKVFNVTFKIIPQDRISDLLKKRDSDLLKEVVIGWSDYGDIKGKEIPFSEEALAKLLSFDYVRAAMTGTFFEAINGYERKN